MSFDGVQSQVPKGMKLDAVESNAVEVSKSKGKRRILSFIEGIVMIGLIALGAILPAVVLGNAIENKSKEISAKIEEGSGTEVIEEQHEAETAPAEAQHPMDLSWAWPILGIAGGGAGTVLLTVLSVGAIKRSRRTSLEHRMLEETRAEDRRKSLAAWQKYVDTHRELKAKVIEIETDWDMLFSYPTLADSSVPQTREFHRALMAADAAPTDPPAELNLSMAIGELPYPKLVTEAQAAWDAAWSFAKLTGTKLIPKDERKKIEQILQLLKLARDSGGSEHERSVAYERAEKLIGELQFVKVPEAALKAIGVEARLMIEAPAEVQAEASRIIEKVAIAL